MDALDYNNTKTNIVVGGYPTSHFDVSPLAIAEFELLAEKSSPDDLRKVRAAAVHVDQAFALLKMSQALDAVSIEFYLSFEEHLSHAESILDELGVLADHYYLRDYHEEDILAKVHVPDEDMDDEGWDVETDENFDLDIEGEDVDLFGDTDDY